MTDKRWRARVGALCLVAVLCLALVSPGAFTPAQADTAGATAGPSLATAGSPADSSADQGGGQPAADNSGAADSGAAAVNGADSGAAPDLTKSCKWTLSEGKAKPMVEDASLYSFWTNKKANAKVQITLPAGQTGGGLFIIWAKTPAGFSMQQYDADKNGNRLTNPAGS